MSGAKAAGIDRLKAEGSQLAGAGQLEEAAGRYRAVLARAARDTDALVALGVISGMQGDYAEAAAYLERAVKLNPTLVAAHFNLGMVRKHQGQLADAVLSYRRAIELAPDKPAHHNNLGNVYAQLGQDHAAVGCFQRALELQPQAPDVLFNLGKSLRNLGLRQNAIDALQRAIEIRPGFGFALKELGKIHLQLAQTGPAATAYQKAADTAPDDPAPVAGLSNVLVAEHRYQEAFALLEPWLEKPSLHAVIANAFADIARHTSSRETEAIELLERALDNAPITDRDSRAQAHFRLGQLHDRLKQYDMAFEHFTQGNGLRHVDQAKDPAIQDIQALIDAFSTEFITNAPSAPATEVPVVFIVGMPRSGTTLVEQILAAHPAVHGGGELDLLPSLLASIPTGKKLPEGLRALTGDDIAGFARDYLATLQALAPGARRITDKLPANFMNLGFIRLMFPTAHIIHCNRSPLDTCLSCYFQDFAGHHPYATDLDALGHHYRAYERLMAHWSNVLDINRLDIEYETLVAEPETWARRLVAHCGLDWDPACLEFHQSNRVIATASASQVIKPVYNNAAGRWRHYEKHLAPLVRALGQNPQVA